MLGGGMVVSSGHRLYQGFSSQRARRQGGWCRADSRAAPALTFAMRRSFSSGSNLSKFRGSFDGRFWAVGQIWRL
jgi:hypothetical protein